MTRQKTTDQMCTKSTLNYALWNTSAAKGVDINPIFLSSIKHGIDICCQSNITLRLMRTANNPWDLEQKYNEASEDILLPVVRTANLGQFIQHSTSYESVFIPLLESPGIAVLEPKQSSSPLYDTMTASVSLLLLMVLLCVAAGIIVWALDSYFNPSDFPRSFIKGGPEGAWWAFVTMTTVGYGDKTPKSVGARLLTVAWTIAGVALISIFTATVTTALTRDTNGMRDIFGSQVGVFTWTEEHLLAESMGANVTGYHGLVATIDGLQDGEVEMALIDMLHLVPMSGTLVRNDLKISFIIMLPRIHGFTINGLNQRQVACLTREMTHARYASTVHLGTSNVIGKNLSYSTSENVDRIIGVPTEVLLAMTGVIVSTMLLICLVQTLINSCSKSRLRPSIHGLTGSSEYEKPTSLTTERQLKDTNVDDVSKKDPSRDQLPRVDTGDV